MEKASLFPFVGGMLAAFLLTVLFLRGLIPKLKSLKVGQKILEIGPRWHKNKEGTPTMGGIAFIGAILLCAILLCAALCIAFGTTMLRRLLPMWLILFLATANGLVGLIDDRTKLLKKQNQGLTAPQKYLLQLCAAGGSLLLMRLFVNPSTDLYIPVFQIELHLGFFYYVIALILITGVVNSVNLGDGIDGLASAQSAIIAAFFALISFSALPASDALGPALASGLCIGGVLGFLMYNFYPARIFMGDTGSLFLGGFLSGLSFSVGNPLLLLLAAFPFIFETISVILQTTYFKYTRIRYGQGKRIFKMTPIHHHFEKCGWNERKIVAVFSLATLIFCAVSYILEYMIL